jgi:hypothetical protein
MPCILQNGFDTQAAKNRQSTRPQGSASFSPGSPRLTKPSNLVGRVDAINSQVEDLMRMTRRSLGQSKAQAKVRPDMRNDSSDLSDGAGNSTASTRSPSSIGLTTSHGVLVLDAAAVQRNFDTINSRIDNILQDQEHIKQGQNEIMELLRMRAVDS